MGVRLTNPVVLRGVSVIQGLSVCTFTCTFIYACRGGPNCRNPYKIDKERASEDDNDDCAEADGDIDLTIIIIIPMTMFIVLSS